MNALSRLLCWALSTDRVSDLWDWLSGVPREAWRTTLEKLPGYWRRD